MPRSAGTLAPELVVPRCSPSVWFGFWFLVGPPEAMAGAQCEATQEQLRRGQHETARGWCWGAVRGCAWV